MLLTQDYGDDDVVKNGGSRTDSVGSRGVKSSSSSPADGGDSSVSTPPTPADDEDADAARGDNLVSVDVGHKGQ